jgi:hypothetical protein
MVEAEQKLRVPSKDDLRLSLRFKIIWLFLGRDRQLIQVSRKN